MDLRKPTRLPLSVRRRRTLLPILVPGRIIIITPSPAPAPAPAALQKLLEAGAHAHDGTEVPVREDDHVRFLRRGGPDAAAAAAAAADAAATTGGLERLGLGQRHGRLQRVADLAPVPAQPPDVGRLECVLPRRGRDVDLVR